MRLFISVNFDDETKDALCAHIDKLRSVSERGNFTKRDNLHLTLVFIGETTQIGAIVDTIDSIDMEEFSICLDGTGKFKRSGGDIFWVGVEKNQSLTILHKLLYRSLVRKGISLDKNDFKPHLTLGREVVLKDGISLNDLGEFTYEKPIDIRSVSLMKSERGRDGLVYTEIYAKALTPIEE